MMRALFGGCAALVALAACGTASSAVVDTSSAEDAGGSPDAAAISSSEDGGLESPGDLLDAGSEPDAPEPLGLSCGSTTVPPGDRCFPLNVSCKCAGGLYGPESEHGSVYCCEE